MRVLSWILPSVCLTLHLASSAIADTNDLPTFRRPVVLVTGYWPPTNEMMRPWNPRPEQNPTGWIGENWERFGYDVVALFPEFPNGIGIGTGDFEVDRSDTRRDFKKYTAKLKPVAILSFGLGDGPWEIETNAPDYWTGSKKTYQTTVPREDIQRAVTIEAPIEAWIDDQDDAGDYLCGYISFLGARYAARHPEVKAQGFIHVGEGFPEWAYRRAFEATLRSTLKHIGPPTL